MVTKLTDKINTTSSHKLILAHMPLIMVCIEVVTILITIYRIAKEEMLT